MRKCLRSWLPGLAVAAAGLGLVSALAAPVTAAPIGPLDDPDNDGVVGAEDQCPSTAGTTSTADGFAGCVRVGQNVYQVLTGARVSGQVVPQGTWQAQDVCRTGILATLRTRQFTDHDRATGPVLAVAQAMSDANGFFDFDIDLPMGTEYSVELSPRKVSGTDAYCASERTSTYRRVETVARDVVASYRIGASSVVGRAVVVADADSQVAEPCSDEQRATVWRRYDDRPSEPVASTTFLGADEMFSIEDVTLVDGAPYYIEVAERGPEGFPDTCLEARAIVVVNLDDRDDDEVANSDDQCPAVPGPLHGAIPGCPVVERQLTAAYDGTDVSGTLTIASYPPGTSNPCENAMRVMVWTEDDQGGRTFVADALASGGMDQTYSVAVGHLPDRTRYLATTEQVPQSDIALCGAAESQVKVSDDRDDDGVADAADSCRELAGPPPEGCPVVQRDVSARYLRDTLTGRVTVTSLGQAAPGSCTGPALVQAWRLADGTWAATGQPRFSAADGTYAIPLAADPDTTLRVSVDDGTDRELALCRGAVSPPVVAFGDRDDDSVPDEDDACPDVPAPTGFAADGCPVVEREVTGASYAVGRVSGSVVPVDEAVAPGACAGAPVAVSWQVETDGEVRRTDVRADGSFDVEVGRLPVGTVLSVASLAFDHDEVAVCRATAAVSVTVASDRDDDAVPDSADQCPDVQGPRRDQYSGCPSLQRRMTGDYTDGVLSGRITVEQVAGVPAGACSRRSALEVVSLEGFSWKDTLGVGWSEADGSYALPVGRLEHGTRYYAWADGYFDPGSGYCLTADVEWEFQDRDGDGVPDRDDLCGGVSAPSGYQGCPIAERSVTSKYDATGAVSGRVRLTNPEIAPGTCLQATVQVFRIGADGTTTLIGSKATEPDGSYRIVPEPPLVGGDAYFAVMASSIDRELAFCAGGQSGARAVPG